MRNPNEYRRVMVVVAIFFACLLSACQSGLAPVTHSINLENSAASSGIEGQIFIGPVSAVTREGDPEVKPFQAVLIVKTHVGEELARINTDAEGRFRQPLPPGTYLLVPVEPDPSTPPWAIPQAISVEANNFTHVEISYDSGIR